jgi:RimJ/RimL family protein N-acetyltransferase
MDPAFLVGDKLYLRPLAETDIDGEYLAWLHDPDVTRYLETGRFPSTPETLRAYLRRFEHATDNLAFAIVDKATDLHIGNVTLNAINWVHRTADTGLMIGRKEFWGRGYAFEAWSVLIEYAFTRLNLRKLIAGVIEDNAASLHVLRRLGFQIEGTRRAAVFVDGSYRNSLLLGMFRDEFYQWAATKSQEEHRA